MCSKGAGERMAIPLNQFRQELYESFQRAALEKLDNQARAQQNLYNPGGFAGVSSPFAPTVQVPTVQMDYATDSVVIMGKRITRKELEEMAPGTVGAQIADMLHRGETEKLRELQKDTLEQLNVLMSGEPRDHLAERFDGLIFDPEKDK